ncbi:MAG TPA: HEAT repeat domain-containing protein [Planctomycetota bacterium]|nr:HEAT repeat domain-containing protein [Planctomycetota bacterium]
MRHSVLAALLLGLVAQSAFAHGGQYVPPPDASGGTGSGSNGAPPTNPMGAGTPSGGTVSGGVGTHGDGARGGGRNGKQARTGLPDLGETRNDWEAWWDANKDRYLDLRSRALTGPRSRSNRGHLANLGRREADQALRRPDSSRIDSELVPFLRGLIESDGDRDVLDSSVLALARSSRDAQAEAVIATALPLLAHDELSVQTSATLSLGVLDSPLAVETLTALAVDSSDGRTLAGGRGAVPSLVRAFAALSLGLLDDAGSVDTLRELIVETPDADRDLKACAIVALGLMENERSPDATRFLLGLLADRKLDAVVKSYVPTSIGKLCAGASGSDPSVLPELLAAFGERDTDAMVRQSLAIALGQLGEVGPGEAAGSPVVQALLDYVAAGKDAATRQFGLIALAQIAARDGAAAEHGPVHAAIRQRLAAEITRPSAAGHRPWALIAAALYGREQPDARADFALLASEAYESEKDPAVRSAAALALGLLEARSMAPAIFEDWLSTAEPHFKGYAALALGLLGHVEAAERLRAECGAKTITPGYRMQVATALGLLGDREAIAVLSETLEGSQTLGVSAAVAKALGLIGDDSALAPLMTLAGDGQRGAIARAFACVALGMVCEKTSLPWNVPIMESNNYLVAVPAIAEVCDIL